MIQCFGFNLICSHYRKDWRHPTPYQPPPTRNANTDQRVQQQPLPPHRHLHMLYKRNACTVCVCFYSASRKTWKSMQSRRFLDNQMRNRARNGKKIYMASHRHHTLSSSAQYMQKSPSTGFIYKAIKQSLDTNAHTCLCWFSYGRPRNTPHVC